MVSRALKRTKKQSNESIEKYLIAGRQALQYGDRLSAYHAYREAVLADPKSKEALSALCSLLKLISFQKFSPENKKAVSLCMQAKGIDYQDLWQPWFSLIKVDPDYKSLQDLMNTREIDDLERLKACLSKAFFINGLERFIVFDIKFERAMKKLRQLMQTGEIFPKNVVSAFKVYCSNTEYVFCDDYEFSMVTKPDDTIETLSLPAGHVSEDVRSQYESNPYPQWTSCNPGVADESKTHRHLIAGCGTGHSTCLTALRFPKAEIVAIDLSRASLSYAKRKARENGIKNVTFYQADILDLSKLEGEFDVIECSGVLHHMDDPIKGWGQLLGKLKPDGKMNIGLYSELARADVNAARELIAETGMEPTPQNIKNMRVKIADLPEGHAARNLLSRRDFYSLSSCRDLIFHVQEHQFTIPKIKAALDSLGLKFLGFRLSDADMAQKYLKQYPEDRTFSDLENWGLFEQENPSVFKGMYQFWCSRK